ncbi:MAG: serine/threonine protein kinase [Myxococcales bacterium]|nr:serine/threonine protein kinase [Myxococcales bacterium]
MAAWYYANAVMEASRETFGNWRIGRHLGGGTWTEVVLAESATAAPGASPPVALKRLTRNGKRTADLVELFASECALLQGTPPHPHLVKFLDTGKVGSMPWLTTEFIPAPTLAVRLAGDEPLSPVELSAIVVDIGAALAHLHAHGMVHCDVSPTNIIVGQQGAVLCDLGVATPIGQRANDRGTPGYLAPEQIIGDVVSPATDIFALGIVWWRR